MSLAFAAAAAEDAPSGLSRWARDPPTARALGWLSEHFDPRANTGLARAFGSSKGSRTDANWRHYWLWSVERAAAACGADAFGKHDWYAQGAEVLVEEQREDGSWRNPERDRLATCFALLFFRRSTRRAITPSSRVKGPITYGANDPKASPPSPPRGEDAGDESGGADGDESSGDGSGGSADDEAREDEPPGE